MSGTSLLRPRPAQLLEKSFRQVVEGLGVQSSSSKEQIRTLLDISMDQLREHAGPQVSLGPMVDGDIIPRATTYQELSEGEPERLFPGIAHCKRIIMGDCQGDVGNLIQPLKQLNKLFAKIQLTPEPGVCRSVRNKNRYLAQNTSPVSVHHPGSSRCHTRPGNCRCIWDRSVNHVKYPRVN